MDKINLGAAETVETAFQTIAMPIAMRIYSNLRRTRISPTFLFLFIFGFYCCNQEVSLGTPETPRRSRPPSPVQKEQTQIRFQIRGCHGAIACGPCLCCTTNISTLVECRGPNITDILQAKIPRNVTEL